MSIKTIVEQGLRLLDRNSPAILTGLAVAGVASTAYLTGKAAYKSAGILKDYEEKDSGLWIKASNKEKFDLVWRLYIPPFATGFMTVACIIGAQSLNHARQAALISGLSIAEGSFREYREKNVELFGEKNDVKVRDENAKENILRDPPTTEELAMVGITQVICKDLYSGRYFPATKEDVKAARNEINEQILNGDNYASLNEFYGRLGLEPIRLGEDVGWSILNMLDINFTSVLTDKGVPCLAIDFRAFPQQDYDKYL